jgi:RNA polymerase sigma factor (sigma-70 family)
VASDTELLYAWRDGERSAGEELFKRYYGLVERFFANKIADPRGDLVQETLMACVKARDRIRENGSFRSYLFGVAYKVLARYLKRKYELPGALGSISLHDLAPGPSTIMQKSEQVHLLLQALRRLPLELQIVVELRYWEQMTSTEISDVLGVSAATIRGQLRQGRRRLEEALRAVAEDPGVLKSTLSDIDGWAEKIREGMGRLSA